jgi:hypothetical protein
LQTQRYYAQCLVSEAVSLFDFPVVFNSCATRAMHSLYTNVRRFRIDNGRKYLKLALFRLFSIYPKQCFLKRCRSKVNDKYPQLHKTAFRRLLMLNSSSFDWNVFHPSVVVVGLVSSSQSVNVAAMISPKDGFDVKVAVLSVTKPFESVSHYSFTFPNSLLIDSRLCAVFVSDFKSLFSSDVKLVATDILTDYVLSRMEKKGNFRYKSDLFAKHSETSVVGVNFTSYKECDITLLKEAVKTVGKGLIFGF